MDVMIHKFYILYEICMHHQPTNTNSQKFWTLFVICLNYC